MQNKPHKTNGKKPEQVETPVAEGAEAPASAAPLKPKRKMSPAELFRLVAEYPDRSGLLLYVYRLWPVIKKPPRKQAIMKATSLTEDELLSRWGSGQYQIMLTDANAPGRSCRSIVDIKDVEHPPVIEPGTLSMDAPENQDYIAEQRGKGNLPGDDMAENQASSVAVKEVVDFSREVLHNNRAQSDGGAKSLEVLANVYEKARAGTDPLALLAKLKELLPAPAPSGDSVLVKSLLEQNTLLLSKLIDNRAPAAGAADPLKQYAQIDELVERAAQRHSGGGNNGGSSLLEVFGPAVPAIVTFLGSLVSRMQAPAAAPVYGGYPPAAPVSLPADAAVHVDNPAAAPASAAQDDGGLIEMLGAFGIPPAIALRLKEVGAKALAAFSRGVSGDDFAQALVTMDADGEEVYAALLQFGKPSIMRLATMLGGEAAKDTAALEAWVDAFIAYDEASLLEVFGPASTAAEKIEEAKEGANLS